MNEDERLLVTMAGRLSEGDLARRSFASELPLSFNVEKNIKADNVKEKSENTSSTVTPCIHYFTLTILGVLVWGLLWSTWGDGWRWDGQWFRLSAVAIVAWASGEVLQGLTDLPALLASLIIGILARNLGLLDMTEFKEIDAFLRRIFPVVILGKASLGWNVSYMRSNWIRVATLGALPWLAEVVAVAACTKYIFKFPWIWGFLLGSIYASVSCAVVMPSVMRLGASSGSTRNWAQLVCTAGGIDTGLSVGVYGLFFSLIFHEENDIYKYTKAAVTLFLGVALGVMWGSVAKLAPHSRDLYVAELRILFVLVGGLFANFLLLHFGWAGTGGVAVLACNATAAMHWAKDGWTLNKNPASTAYRVMWTTLEPILFAYTGTFFVIDSLLWEVMLLGLGILFLCLTVRLAVAALMCWDMTLKERMFLCCTWVPKSIVEAVLGPLALNLVITRGGYAEKQEHMMYAECLLRLVVQAILITTPIGFLLTKYLGPKLLNTTPKDVENKA